MGRRRSFVAVGIVLSLLLLMANCYCDSGDPASPCARSETDQTSFLSRVVGTFAFDFSWSMHVFWVALILLALSAFTRADRLRLCAAAIVLGILLAAILQSPTMFLFHTVQLRLQKAQLTESISNFVAQHGRAPTTVQELYPQGGAPSLARDELRSPRMMREDLPKEKWESWRSFFAFPEAVVVKDPRLRRIHTIQWRYDPGTCVWTTDSVITCAGLWAEALGPLASLPFLTMAMVITAITLSLAYRPWRRLGEQQRSSIKPEET